MISQIFFDQEITSSKCMLLIGRTFKLFQTIFLRMILTLLVSEDSRHD